MRIVIGYDGSESGDAALEDLRRAGLSPDSEAVVLSVADVSPAAMAGFGPLADGGGLGAPGELSGVSDPVAATTHAELTHDALTRARADADGAAARLRGWFPRWTVRADARAGSPYSELVALAEEWSADLIVVGSHGRSGAGRLILGSVSQNVLSHATCSVRISRAAAPARTGAADAPVRLLVGIDGSPDAAAAVSAVRDRHWPPRSEARVVTTVDLKLVTALKALSWIGGPKPAPPAGDGPSWARHAADAVSEDLRDAGLTVAASVVEGDPKRVLPTEAESWGADCIFVGAKGHSRLERFLLGSVSASVAARAHCSVEVVRQG